MHKIMLPNGMTVKGIRRGYNGLIEGDIIDLDVRSVSDIIHRGGTVLYTAEGKLRPEDIPEILDSGNRTLAGPTAPPGGLYLTRVWYEDERLNGTDEI